ncbi:hypothetical protein EVAR_95157_1 [Eumeta japonica]|uniref:Uncharacterized protein n=1 Tax=Eumeta variegata TaxID=151549 RepID=A0A4C1VI30_EUMVA|nr:hypothetical protein EVAR_95157_1 [Eumeta japonica]
MELGQELRESRGTRFTVCMKTVVETSEACSLPALRCRNTGAGASRIMYLCQARTRSVYILDGAPHDFSVIEPRIKIRSVVITPLRFRFIYEHQFVDAPLTTQHPLVPNDVTALVTTVTHSILPAPGSPKAHTLHTLWQS